MSHVFIPFDEGKASELNRRALPVLAAASPCIAKLFVRFDRTMHDVQTTRIMCLWMPCNQPQ